MLILNISFVDFQFLILKKTWFFSPVLKKINRNKKMDAFQGCTLREKCPYRGFFLVRIFPHSDWIRRLTPYLSVFSLNAGKYGPEKSPYLDTFYSAYSKLSQTSKINIFTKITNGFNYIFAKSCILISFQNPAQKMKVSIKDFSSKCDQIRSFLRIWSHLLKKSLTENFIFLCCVARTSLD